eukprot:11164959-Lingulodinium_polyedra.AAC.1
MAWPSNARFARLTADQCSRLSNHNPRTSAPVARPTNLPEFGPTPQTRHCNSASLRQSNPGCPRESSTAQ